MQYTKETLAALLDGREYRDEITKEEAKDAERSGLVVVFGYSDDNVEFRGAITDELGCYRPQTFYVHRRGLLLDPSHGECEHCVKRTAEVAKKCAAIEARHEDGWRFNTQLPIARFTINEDGQFFGEGFVFELSDAPEI